MGTRFLLGYLRCLAWSVICDCAFPGHTHLLFAPLSEKLDQCLIKHKAITVTYASCGKQGLSVVTINKIVMWDNSEAII